MNKPSEHFQQPLLELTPLQHFQQTLLPPTNFTNSSPDEFFPNFYNAYFCAKISQLCYKSSVGADHMDNDYKDGVRETLKQWGWSKEDVEKTLFINSRVICDEDGLSIPGTQGLILFHKKTAFIAFRGSERKLNDWLTNIKTEKVNLHYYPDNKQNLPPNTPGKVHRGFLKAFNAILSNVPKAEEKIEQLRNMDAIWLTGHSLGGAIASIGASYLLKRGFFADRIYIYTFGAPRVGDADYREYMNKNFTYRYWRFLHNHDIVPDVPFPGLIPFMARSRLLFIGFSRDGCMLRLKEKFTEKKDLLLRLVYHDGTRKFLKHYNGISVKHHSIDAYCERLLNLANSEANSKLPEMKLDKVPIPPGTIEIEKDITCNQLKLVLLRIWINSWLLLLLGLLGLVGWLIVENNNPTTIQPQPSAIINKK